MGWISRSLQTTSTATVSFFSSFRFSMYVMHHRTLRSSLLNMGPPGQLFSSIGLDFTCLASTKMISDRVGMARKEWGFTKSACAHAVSFTLIASSFHCLVAGREWPDTIHGRFGVYGRGVWLLKASTKEPHSIAINGTFILPTTLPFDLHQWWRLRQHCLMVHGLCECRDYRTRYLGSHE